MDSKRPVTNRQPCAIAGLGLNYRTPRTPKTLKPHNYSSGPNPNARSTFATEAYAPGWVRVRSTPDGKHWDTVPLARALRLQASVCEIAGLVARV